MHFFHYLSFNEKSSANIIWSPFIKINIYSIRFVVIKRHIKTDFASTLFFIQRKKKHGQLYVAISRATFRYWLKILIVDEDGEDSNKTSNMYKEVFRNKS
jgi:hypothetical protein